MKHPSIGRIFAVFLFTSCCMHVKAQVNLPYTLTFTSDDPSAWSDGIAQDGDGGTQNINGLDIQVYAADASFNKLSGSTIIWHNNTYYNSNDGSYNGITPGPDVTVSNNGVPGMVIKSTSQANNFSMESIEMYDWGGNPDMTIAAYDNGALKGSVDVTFDDVNFTPMTIAQSDALTPSLFNNVDEVRFYPKGASTCWLSFNNIRLNVPATVTPIRLSYFKAARQDNGILFQWRTAQEENSGHFEVQESGNGHDFATIASTPAKGNSRLPSDYSLQYVPQSGGRLLYRLKEVDLDGQSFFSSTVVIDSLPAATQCRVYPNPASSMVYIDNGKNKLKEIKVYAASGLLIKHLNGIASPTAAIDLTGLPQGMYYFILARETGDAFTRIVWKE